MESNSQLPHCFHFGTAGKGIRSPRIPIRIDGIVIPVVVDTGAEVSMLSDDAMIKLFPNGYWASNNRKVKSLSGDAVKIKRPLRLPVEVCRLPIVHEFYHLDGMEHSLLGFDLFQAASLVIDCELGCIWSSSVVGCHPCLGSSKRTSKPISTVEASTQTPPLLSFDDSNSVSSETDVKIIDLPTDPQILKRMVEDIVIVADASAHAYGEHEGPDVTDIDFSQDLEPAGHVDSQHAYCSLTFSKEAETLALCCVENISVPDTSKPEVELPQHLQVLFLQMVENSELSQSADDGLRQLLLDHQDTFAKSKTDIGLCNVVQHDIDTGDTRPIKQSPRRPPLNSGTGEDDIIQEMLSAGIIQPSDSAWASPVCLVRKKDNTYRFCIDYRKLNAVSHKDAHPLPDIREALDSLKGARHFAVLDLLNGYWQIENSERAKERSAFCCRRGLFEFTRMSFGLCGAPATFARAMQTILRGELWKICLCYLDDIIIFGSTELELLERFRTVLDRLRDAGLKIKPSKCLLFQTEIQYLGHLVTADGIKPLPDKMVAIKNFPEPKCLRDVRAFYGLASYYRRFVKNFAKIAEPLSSLTKKQDSKFYWTAEAQVAFDKLKEALCLVPVLSFPQAGQPCILDTDASDFAVGAVLSQLVCHEVLLVRELLRGI